MRARLSSWWELRKLKAEDMRLSKSYDKARFIAEQERRNYSYIHDLNQKEHFERKIYQDQISQIKSQRLCLQAYYYDIFISQSEDWWEDSTTIGGRFLSAKGFNELRAAIRKEQNERWAYWELRIKVLVTFATALTGVAGAFIGLAAVLKK